MSGIAAPISGVCHDVYPQLLVFVSFSMPFTTLKALAKQVNESGGTIVFRGFVDGSVKKTIPKLKELGEPALIDPTLFEAYKIEMVPTFVLRKRSSDKADIQVPHDRISGNVSLFHALEQFESRGDARHAAQTLLKKLKP